jgi:glycosyltransferase involved in cell wall biosynthesis
VHVAVVCPGLGSGGSVAAVALRGAREIARSARVTLISDTYPQDVGSLATIAIPGRNLQVLRRFRHVPESLAFAKSVRKALFELSDVDVVLCHSHSIAALAARPFRNRSGVPFALVVHGEITDTPSGTFDWRLRSFYHWVSPRAYRSADLVIVLSTRYAAIARQQGAHEVTVIPNGFDLAEIGGVPERHHRNPGEALRILYVGRLAIEKGIQVLVDASNRLEVEHTLDIVGSGPLEAMLRKHGSNRIRFLGFIPRNELGAVYAAHDVACVPSLTEPFGLVVAEALAAGLPVIGSSTGGIPDMIRDGFNGLLVRPNDADALSRALKTIAVDDSLRRSLASQARASVIPRLSWEIVGQRLVGALKQVGRVAPKK